MDNVDSPDDAQSVQHRPDVPPDPVTEALERVRRTARSLRSGEVNETIPELAEADPELFGIALVSSRGHRYQVGDSGHGFTLQSASKPFVYALALADHGLDRVHEHVGFEPSGEPFNSISLDAEGRPDNPMINAGAIVTSALVGGASTDERFERIRATLGAFAGRELELDEDVYASERDSGERNRALAHLARAAGVLPVGAEEATDLYFRQCSLLVDSTDLAAMGATLAAGGVQPLTGERVVSEECARHTLSLMISCGMYDGAGEWMMRVGMPAKSGISGGIVAVKPGQFGIGVFSPRLDPKGNSTRGVAVLGELADSYGLHLLGRTKTPESPVSGVGGGDGHLVLHLRGQLDFVEVELLVHDLHRRVHDRAAGADLRPSGARLTLDLSDVTAVSTVARGLLVTALRRALEADNDVTVVDPAGLLDPADLPGELPEVTVLEESDDNGGHEGSHTHEQEVER